MKDKELYLYIESKLDEYQEKNGQPLKGIINPANKDIFIRQMIDSVKRIKYIRLISKGDISEGRINPNDELFDPIKAAVWHYRNGNIDEAIWLVFLLTHFGKHVKYKWELLKAVYGNLGGEDFWSWTKVSHNKDEFLDWLEENEVAIKSKGAFSNHRKYVSISAAKRAGTGQAISSYINMIGYSHVDFIESIDESIKNNPKLFFRYLYNEFRKINGFGRLATFDFITMVGKIGIVNIEPDSPCLKDSTGPFKGAKELYGLQNISATDLETYLIDLGNFLELDFVMQVLEDSICNWQKNMNKYIYFKG
jgi:hypothetical protein